MAKRKSANVQSSANVQPSTYVWALPVGITVLTSEDVDTSKRPTRGDMERMSYEFERDYLPRVVAALRAAGINVPDDTWITDNPFPANRSTGVTASAHIFAPAPASAKPSGNGNGHASTEPAPGPLSGEVHTSDEPEQPAKPAKRGTKPAKPVPAKPAPTSTRKPAKR